MSICTDAFRVPAAAMADMYGLPDFPFVTLPHPIASLTAAQIEVRVGQIMPEVLRILRGTEAAGGAATA